MTTFLSSLVPLRRLPAWMQTAFGLADEEVPRQLDVGGVVSVVDVVQGGWGIDGSQWIYNQLVLTGPIPASVAPHNTLLAADPTRVRLVAGISVARAGGTAGTIRTPAIGMGIDTTRNVFLAEFDIAVDDDIPWAGISESAGDVWVVPPGSRLAMTSDALIAAEVWTINVLTLSAPAGFKVR